MSYSFQSADAADQVYLTGQGRVTAPPFSMSCWFYPADAASNYILMSLADNSTHTNAYNLWATGGLGDEVKTSVRDNSGTVWAATTNTFSATTWHHSCALFQESDPYETVYLDGDTANKGTNSTDKDPTGVDAVGIGAAIDASPSGWMDGYIAEAAIWNVKLAEAEVVVLSKGYSPLFVRPASLIWYLPLLRVRTGELDTEVVSGDGFDRNGTVGTAAHPRIIYPAPVLGAGAPSAAVAGTGPVFWHHYRQLHGAA